MKLILSIPGKRFSAGFPDDKGEATFAGILHGLLKPSEPPVNATPMPTPVQPAPAIEKPANYPVVKRSPSIDATYCYHGFLYMKCPSCGTVKGFCTKADISSYHCSGCGASFEFSEPLKELTVICECRHRFLYRTNLTDPMFDIN